MSSLGWQSGWLCNLWFLAHCCLSGLAVKRTTEQVPHNGAEISPGPGPARDRVFAGYVLDGSNLCSSSLQETLLAQITLPSYPREVLGLSTHGTVDIREAALTTNTDMHEHTCSRAHTHSLACPLDKGLWLYIWTIPAPSSAFWNAFNN